MEKLSKEQFKQLSKITVKKYRQQAGKVIVSGMRLIRQTIQNGVAPELIIVSDPEVIKTISPAEIPIRLATSAMLNRLCDTRNPQEVAALYKCTGPEPEAFKL
ncbi:MAG: hypothetical protein K8S56_02760, partial [Candidatus Cloacimonetes bacterium]|nr:hypothetical protein [Candidatus Cloacimonadota bacterium]